ncbi:hypothetical protein BY996DRAFT_3511578 [Phakopsora pachyrhizi]|nr:hypothetical protein BY996DRAFT_3511578 [Phakopsora pachyrhizi]
MADIAKRVLTLVDYQQKRKEDNGFRIFDFQNSISRDALDDLILDRDYTNLCVEFCSAFKALDKAKRFLKGPYFKLDGDSNFEDEDIYSWREIALRILDYLVVASPNIENYNAGKAIVKKVLEDIVVAKIVKQQFLQALNIENFQVRNYDNIDNYIKASIPNKGLINIFGGNHLIYKILFLIFHRVIHSAGFLHPSLF